MSGFSLKTPAPLCLFLAPLYLTFLRKETVIYYEHVQCVIQKVFSPYQLETTQTTMIKIKVI